MLWHRAARGKDAAFTMVEIALCLGVIAIALVAIIGVLPTGVRVQKDNREDTVINQEGLLWLEAIRSGAQGLDYLTNYVDTITISNKTGLTNFYNQALGGTPPPPPNANALTNGQTIIGLLTYPKVTTLGNTFLTNLVVARVRAISGSAADKGPSQTTRDFAFGYRIISEVVSVSVYPPEYLDPNAPGITAQESASRTNRARLERNRLSNFEELRLTLQGPLIPKGTSYDVLGTPKTFRTLISGPVLAGPVGKNLVQPSIFIQVQ